jgi:Tol biopolymer transport system component/Ser/Thr protein kinase RdoA (MazF antagonist)
MPLTPGTRLGPYEIVSPLGQGGMGEVYRARDTRLGRDVAIKVLPEHLSAQPEVRARFEREARTVSSLNHPNICALFDVGREGDVDYLVLELVDGETLEQRLARGRVPTAEALRLGAQVADALDRAHRAGVVHRDLKPSNVMLTRAGAKLMDFGLARAVGMVGDGAAGSLTQSPTMARALTAEGTLLGTFQYMAPEQLEGREADARSDIWALGCVLYELFAGRRAFEGRSQASLIAAILEREPPPVGELPSGAPPASTSRIVPPQGIERLIRNCLAKDPEERIQTAHDVKLQLRGIAEGASIELTGVPPGSSSIAAGGPTTAALAEARTAAARSVRLAWGVAALALASAATALALLWPAAHRTPPVLRFTLPPVDDMSDIMWPRVSPDGRFMLLRMADSTGATIAGVRRMDQVDVHEVPGTRDLQRPYWSPDGREVAFVANGKLQRVALAGGSPIVICDAPFGSDLSWGAKGKILVDGRATDSLLVVPAGGGALEPATRVDRAGGEVGSSWPSFLPDGERFLFIGTNPSGNGGTIRLGKLGSLDAKVLGRSDGRVEWAPGDWVLFVQGALLMAQKLDLGAGKLVGPPIQITDQLRIGSSAGHFSVSSNGILAFARDPGGTIKLQVMSRAGVLSPSVLATGTITNPAVSPDGRRLLYERVTSPILSRGEMHVLDLDRKTDTRLTFTNDLASSPLWSPDGRRIAYQVEGPGGPTVRIASADGLGGQDSISVPSTMGILGLSDWAPGRILAFGSGRVWQLPTEGTTRNATPLFDPTLFIVQGRISPDGRWLAATSGTPPTFNAFVYGLGDNPGRWQLSGGTTFRPRWTKGGSEIVFESTDRQLWAVDVDTKYGFRAGAPRRLFTLPMGSPGNNAKSWDCDASGETFYVTVPADQAARGSIEIVSDFRSLVTRR